MNAKETAARNAADAITVAIQALGEYRPGTPEMSGAALSAVDAINAALAAGATEDDIRAATTGPVFF